jgi:ubiquinone/menaquinone biosynthesis C-methylase UbiE
MTEWNADEYACQSTLQQTLADEQLARLTLAGTERVLDVGCGDGKITAEIAAQVPRGSVVGVDPSHQMIDFAANHFAPSAWPNLRFVVADARELPFRSEFDLVVSFNALHWVTEQEAALRSIHQALKPGGRAILQFVPRGPIRGLEDVVDDRNWDFGSREAFAAFSRATFVEWTQHLPERDQSISISEVLQRYRASAANDVPTANLFQFYQMTIELTAFGS